MTTCTTLGSWALGHLFAGGICFIAGVAVALYFSRKKG